MLREDEVPTIDDYRRGVIDRWKLIAACTLITALVGFGLGMARRAEAWQTKVSLESNADTVRVRDLIPARTAAADAAVASGIAREIEARPSSGASVSITYDEDADTIEITAHASAADASRDAVDEIVVRLTELRRDETLAQIDTYQRVIEDQITTIDEQVAAGEAAGAEAGASIDNLLVERSRLRGQQLGLGELEESTTGGIRATGEPSTQATSGLLGVTSLTVLGVLLGLAIGVVAALLATVFDRSIRSRGQLARVSPNVPTLAVVGRNGGDRGPQLVALQMAVLHLLEQRGLRSLQFASVGSPEAGARIVVDLAKIFAEAGERVVVVDADLRHGLASSMLGMTSGPGLGALTDTVALDELLTVAPGSTGVGLVPAGAIPGDPVVLQQRSFAKLVAAVRGEALVLVSTDGTNGSADAALVAREVDATVLVVPYGRATDLEVSGALQLLGNAGCAVDGFVLDGVPGKRLALAAAGG